MDGAIGKLLPWAGLAGAAYNAAARVPWRQYYNQFRNRNYTSARGRYGAYFPGRTTKRFRGGGRYRQSSAYRRSNVRSRVPEKKFYDTTQIILADKPLSIPTTSSNGGLILTLAQGTGQSQRIGRKIRLHSLIANGTAVFAPAAGTVDSDVLHYYVIMDRQTNGAWPNIADMFINSATTAFMLRNLDNDTRFRVLKHGICEFASEAGATTAYGGVVKQIQFVIPLKGIEIEYNSTAGAITEIKENNLFLVAGSQAVQLTTLTLATRVRYYDV